MKLFGLNNNLKIVDDKVIKKNIEYFNGYFDINKQLEVLNYLKKIDVDFLLSPIDAKIKDGKLISSYKYIKNCKTFNDVKINSTLIKNVISIIDKLHKICSNNNLHKWEYTLTLNKYKSHINKWVDKDLENDFNFIKQFAEYFDNKKNKFVFSHNDLVPGNFLINDNELLLIDYDYSCNNYYLFDYASFISETIVDNTDLEKEFISICVEKSIILKDDIRDLKKILMYQDYLWMLWSNALYNISNEQIFLEICKEKIKMYKKRKVKNEY